MDFPQKWQMFAPMLQGADIPPLDEFRYYYLPSKFVDIIISLLQEYALEYHYLDKLDGDTTAAMERVAEVIRMFDPVMPCGELILFDMRTTVKAGGQKWVQYTFDGIDWIDLYQIIDGTNGQDGQDGQDATCEDCAGQEYEATITDIGCYTKAAHNIWQRFKLQLEEAVTSVDHYAEFRRDALLKFNRTDIYATTYGEQEYYAWDMLWRDESLIFDPAIDTLTDIIVTPDDNPISSLRLYHTFISYLTKSAMGQTIPTNDVWYLSGDWVEGRDDITDNTTEYAGWYYAQLAWELLAHTWHISDIVDEMRYMANQYARAGVNNCQHTQSDFDEWIAAPPSGLEWCAYIDLSGETGYTINVGTQIGTGVDAGFERFGEESYKVAQVTIPFPSTAESITEILIVHTSVQGTYDPVSGGGSYVYINATRVEHRPIAILDTPQLWEGSFENVNSIMFGCNTGSERQTGIDADGLTTLHSVRIRGTGANPFTGFECT